MGNFTKNPNYEEDSKELAALEQQAREKEYEEASKIISRNLTRAAQKVSSLVDCGPLEESEARGVQIEFKAAAHLLRLGGMEVEKIEHKGKIFFEPLRISREGVIEKTES